MLAKNLRRSLVLASILIATLMTAVEATIVSTAMPQIVTHLGTGLRLYSWVFSAFLLAQAATTMVFGKLTDIFGRKPILLVGIAFFLLTSLLCGLAWSMVSLIVFRLFQGLAAGSIQPATQTLVGDMYPGLERGKAQAYLAAAYGISSVLGPLAGALIVQHLRWAWIFWINIPIGAVAALGLYLFVQERVEAERRPVDVLGAGLFMVVVSSLMLALNSVVLSDRAQTLLFTAVLACSAILFVIQERTTRDPMLPFTLMSRQPLAKLNLIILLCGAVLMGTVTFLPVYVQVVMGRSALTAGFTVTAQVLGWTISAMLAVRTFRRFGLDKALALGSIFFPLGAAILVAMSPGSHPLMAGIGSLTLGLGMGLVNTGTLVIVQGSVRWAERGSATALNIFSRNLGSAIGAAALGMVVNVYFQHVAPTERLGNLSALLQGPSNPSIASPARSALDSALHLVFWAMLLLGALITGLAVLDRKRNLSQPLDEAP